MGPLLLFFDRLPARSFVYALGPHQTQSAHAETSVDQDWALLNLLLFSPKKMPRQTKLRCA
jgi:hypothetical protein